MKECRKEGRKELKERIYYYWTAPSDLITDRSRGRSLDVTCSSRVEEMQGNHASAFQSINVNICSKGTNSSYLIYARLQIGSFMFYQTPHTSSFHAWVSRLGGVCLCVCVFSLSLSVCLSIFTYMKPSLNLNKHTHSHINFTNSYQENMNNDCNVHPGYLNLNNTLHLSKHKY